jgi:hypothetical protein
MKAPERITIEKMRADLGISQSELMREALKFYSKHKFYRAEYILKRLETCNLFKLSTTAKNEFTLVLGSDVPKQFVKMEFEEIFEGMDFKVEIKEYFAKLKVKVLHEAEVEKR